MKVDRLVRIVMLLLDKQRIGARSLAQAFDVSLRTIYRDMNAINLAGIPVRAIPGAGGGFEVMQPYKMDRKLFSTADLTAILTGLTGLSGLMQGEALRNTLAKVKSVIPAGRAREMEMRAGQIVIDLSPWLSNASIQPDLETIKTALEESKLLSFAYADRHGNQTVRVAEPYRLVLKGSHWYWQGFCHARNDFRLFKLARMANLHMLAQGFTPRAAPKPLLAFADIPDATQTCATLRIHQSVMDRVLDYCPLDRFAPDGDEHYLVRFPLFENDYHYDILLSFGTQCECLSPPHVRAELRRRIREMAARYGR